MIRISNLKLPVEYNDSLIKKKICSELRIDTRALIKYSIFKRSIDARKKNNVHFIITVDVEIDSDENKVLARSKCKNAVVALPYRYEIPDCKGLDNRPVIVGFGPAGMFAALILARAGARPIVFEMGKDCDSRVKDIESFIQTGRLNTSSNIQFGEGGAGTFSDGKLTTGTKDSRSRQVLIEFVNHGAPDEILYNAMPHIGTDNLRKVVKNIRNTIIELGGEVNFESKLVSLRVNDGKIIGADFEIGGKNRIVETDNIILAIGHSSRDTFEMLYGSGIILEQKPFSVGVRIEHLRESIDRAQFGDYAGSKKLGAAPYKLNAKASNGRGVYTFCMCPGGEVVPAASENGMVCTNGMSYFERDAVNSNAALLVGVSPEDYDGDNPLAGIEFQRKIERKSYILGGGDYCAPIQRVGDFLVHKKTSFVGEVKPSYSRGTQFAEMDDIFPQYITDAMREGIIAMDRRLNGFACPEAILTGSETRSSSPVRITRNPETLESVSLSGLYPCGEGAGYAGGIVSAAVDGIKCAEKILTKS